MLRRCILSGLGFLTLLTIGIAGQAPEATSQVRVTLIRWPYT